MKNWHSLIIGLIGASIIVAAYSQESKTNDWHPNTKKLEVDVRAKKPPAMFATPTLAHDVTNFYQLLRGKKWDECYELHARAFREDLPKAEYLGEAKRGGVKWGLVNYEVLAGRFENSIGSTNFDQAVLICKFIELPGNTDSYATVYWHYEDGVWRCLSAGPAKLQIFHPLRGAIIDWR